MCKISVHGGHGFIGSEMCKNPDFTPNEDTPDDKEKFVSTHPNFVYAISTVHNYHPVDNNPYIDIETNLKRLMTVLQSNRIKYGNEFSITFVSSWFVYGRQETLPAKETSCCDPLGFYSITKRTAEQLLISYCQTFDIDYKIVRLANVLGVSDSKVSKRKNALQYMISELCNVRPIELYEGSIIRDFVHVSDAAEAIRRVARSGTSGEIYNVGSGEPSDVSKLVRYASEKIEFGGNIHQIPVPDFHKVVQVRDMWLDTSKIESELGWKPVRKINDVVDEIVEYYIGQAKNT